MEARVEYPKKGQQWDEKKIKKSYKIAHSYEYQNT